MKNVNDKIKVYLITGVAGFIGANLAKRILNLKNEKIHIIGHVHIDTTEIYTHLDNQEVKDVMFEHPLAQFKMEDALAYCA